jgi:hypothetical protein
VASIVRLQHVSCGWIGGLQLDGYSQRYCDTPPLPFCTGTNALEQISFRRWRCGAPDKKSARLTRWKFIAKDLTLLRRVCGRDGSVLLKNFVSDTVHGTKPIIRTAKIEL